MNLPAANIENFGPDSTRTGNFLQIPVLNEDACSEETLSNVMGILGSIRDYHSVRNFSHMERFGEPDPCSSKIIPDLDSTIDEIRQLFEQSGQVSGKQLALTYALNIKVHDANTTAR